jgi:hypothetical protein
VFFEDTDASQLYVASSASFLVALLLSKGAAPTVLLNPVSKVTAIARWIV